MRSSIKPRDKVALLKRIISIYTPTGREYRLARILMRELEGYGVDAYIDEVGNLIAIKRGRGERILLAGHMDTVTGYIPVRTINGYIWGRGSVDAKGPLASLLFAFLEVDGEIVFTGLVDEEGGSRGALNLDIPKPKYIIVGEPSGIDGVVIGYKGSLTIRYSVSIPRFHGSIPRKGAAEILIDKWLELSRLLGDGYSEPTGRIISFKAYEDDFMYRGEMVINIRIPKGFSRILDGEVISRVEPYEVPLNSILLKSLIKSIREHGYKPRLKRRGGTSDMNILASRFGVDAVAYGPGDARLDHTPYEHLSIEEYLNSINILRRAIIKLWNSDY